MLTVDQITDHLTRIYDRRRALNRAAAALNLARAVAHLREQFPTAEYAWVHVREAEPSFYVSGSRYSADVLRVHSVTGSVLWDADDEDPEEIESPATDALVWAYDASESSVPAHPGYEHPVAGVAPGIDNGDDPALLTFSYIDKQVHDAVFAAQVTPVAIPQINGGPALVLFAVPSDQVTAIETFDAADAAKLGPPAVVGADEFPGGLFDRDRVADVLADAQTQISLVGDLGGSHAEHTMSALVDVAMNLLDDPYADPHAVAERCYDN